MRDDLDLSKQAKLERTLEEFSVARAAANAMGRMSSGDALILRRSEIEALCAHCPPLRSFIARAVEDAS